MSALLSPAVGRVTSGFGPRTSPGGIGSTNHKGVDIADIDNAIVAAAAGKVVKSTSAAGRGNYVTIDIGRGVQILVQHLASRGVSVGELVIAGQWLGKEGHTGAATGDHCHVEVTVHGVIVNPTTWFAANGVALGGPGTGSWSAEGTGGSTTPPSVGIQRYQQDNNRFGAAGLDEDGVDGPYTKGWRAWAKQAQHALNLYKSELPDLTEDGDYRAKTHTRTREFQKRNGRPITGILSNADCAYMRAHGTKISDRPKTHR